MTEIEIELNEEPLNSLILNKPLQYDLNVHFFESDSNP